MRFVLLNKKLIEHSASRYFVVGITAFGVDYIVLLVCYYGLHIKLDIATSIGFVSGFLISFIANKQWVFGGEQKKRPFRQVIEYASLLVFNFFFTVWAVSFLNSYGIKPFIGKLLVMGLIMCWNYAIFRWVIFAEKTGEII